MAQSVYRGNVYSYQSHTLRIYGRLMTGWKEFAWKSAQERGEQDDGRTTIAFTEPLFKHEASATIPLKDWLEIKADQSQGGRNPRTARGSVTMAVEQFGLPSEYIEVIVAGVEDDRAASKGTDPSEVKLKFFVLDIKENGISTAMVPSAQ